MPLSLVIGDRASSVARIQCFQCTELLSRGWPNTYVQNTEKSILTLYMGFGSMKSRGDHYEQSNINHYEQSNINQKILWIKRGKKMAQPDTS